MHLLWNLYNKLLPAILKFYAAIDILAAAASIIRRTECNDRRDVRAPLAAGGMNLA
jgi:hypothetical protein